MSAQLRQLCLIRPSLGIGSRGILQLSCERESNYHGKRHHLDLKVLPLICLKAWHVASRQCQFTRSVFMQPGHRIPRNSPSPPGRYKPGLSKALVPPQMGKCFLSLNLGNSCAPLSPRCGCCEEQKCCVSSAQQQLKHPSVVNVVMASNPKHSTIAVAMKKISSYPSQNQ